MPTLNVLRTLALTYNWAIIWSFISRVIAFLLFLTQVAGNTGGHFVDIIGYKTQNTIFTKRWKQYTVEYQLFTLTIAWLTGSCRLLLLPSIMSVIPQITRLGKMKIKSAISTKCILLWHHYEVEKKLSRGLSVYAVNLGSQKRHHLSKNCSQDRKVK